MWCIGLALDSWNLSGRCQATQDAQDIGDASLDAQNAGGADLTSRASECKGAVSDAG